METRIPEAEERREENMRRNEEVLASLGFDINEPNRLLGAERREI